MSETPIQPALTPEQWTQLADWNLQPKDMSNSYLGDSVSDYDGYADPRHALAALCLYQQPFGFTQDDVDACTDRANALDEAAGDMLVPLRDLSDAERAEYNRLCAECDAWNARATRIAALLPPQA